MYFEPSFRSFLAGTIVGLLWGFSGGIGRRIFQLFLGIGGILIIVLFAMKGMDTVVNLFEWVFDQLLNYVYFVMGVVNGVLLSYRRA